MEIGCRNCMWLYHMVTYNPTAPCSECLDHDKWQTTKRSNAGRIRAMTDEELAEFESERMCCPPGKPGCEENNLTCDNCEKCWLDWLRQEVSE